MTNGEQRDSLKKKNKNLDELFLMMTILTILLVIHSMERVILKIG